MLNRDMLSFSSFSQCNFVSYVDKVSKGETYSHESMHVTEEEKNEYLKIEKLTKNEIKNKIMTILDTLDDDARTLNEEYFKKEIKNKSKSKHIDYFYYLKDLECHEET